MDKHIKPHHHYHNAVLCAVKCQNYSDQSSHNKQNEMRKKNNSDKIIPLISFLLLICNAYKNSDSYDRLLKT